MERQMAEHPEDIVAADVAQLDCIQRFLARLRDHRIFTTRWPTMLAISLGRIACASTFRRKRSKSNQGSIN
jgi:hypothetical protein